MRFRLMRMGLAAEMLGLLLCLGTTGLLMFSPIVHRAASAAAGSAPVAAGTTARADQGVTVAPEEAAVALEKARAEWFARVYVGRNFAVVESAARHPEP